MVKVGLKEEIDMADSSTQKIMFIFAVLAVLMIISFLFILLMSFRKAKNGANLIFCYDGYTQEEFAKIINTDYREGNFLINESIYNCHGNEKQYGRRIVVTHSYILIVNSGIIDDGKVRYIPREKIYWICAQPGIKGRSSYVVRLLIFTEKEIYSVEGTEVEYVEELANKIYKYIPNVFADYDTFTLSYQLEECFTKNREEFFAFYERKKKKMERK